MTQAVTVEGLSKKFRIATGRSANTLLSRLKMLRPGGGSVDFATLWALQDVSFTVEEGEIFGIIGRNGSGKSTLLKILTGIMRPTRGSGKVRGRVGALLEVGTGFHPDLTGRENVYFNGTLLGMSRHEIDALLDEIVAFAEIENFIDTQFKHYSSGMQSRLGFAVAANLRPEILILDEVLSVGDIMFQEKCMDRIGDLRKSGITILYVSHNLGSIGQMCHRAMLLNRGRVVKIGEVGEVIDEYFPKPESSTAHAHFGNGSNHPSYFNEAALEAREGHRCCRFDLDEDIWLRVRYTVKTPQPGLQLSVLIRTKLEEIVQTYDTDNVSMLGVHPAGVFEKRLRIRRMFLKEGEYYITLGCGTPRELHELHEHVLSFSLSARGDAPTEYKSFRRDRQGKIIFQGEWHELPPAHL
jgi:lipopolysaccharide transport system ATP-binding protein